MIRTRLALTLACALTTSAACSTSPAPAASGSSAAANGSGGPAVPASGPAADTGTVSGTVVETMNAGGYTYMRLQDGSKDVWAAASEMPVKTGEHLTMSISMPMENFRSKTLNRDFPLIYFVSAVARDGETLAPANAPAAPPLAGSHDAAPAAASAATQLVERIAPPAGGMTIADVWAKRKSLAGKPVIVRGKVVKVNNGIMGKNWFHVQDGSGAAKDGTHDLTITSGATVKLGDVITVSGTLTIDKDFGAGYSYDVIIEDGKVTDIGKPANQ